MSKLNRILLASGSMLVLLPTVAMAQATSAVDEVVVTANKRVENVQDIPASVQVANPAVLQRENITDVGDLRKVAPAIQGAGQGLSMRGVSTSATSISAQNKVGVTLDDIPQPSRSILANNLQDVERVEVLPGPQGTLSGRNATGGLINIVTRGPSSIWTGSASAMATTDVEKQYSAFLAGPISDTLQTSVSAFYKDFRGLRKNIFLNKWSERATWGFRTKLQYQPNDVLRITGTAFFQRTVANGMSGAGAAVGGAEAPLYLQVSPDLRLGVDNSPGRTPQTFAQLRPGVTPGPNNTSFASRLDGRSEIEDFGGILRAEFSLGDHTLTSITSGYRETNPILSDGLVNVAHPNQLNVRPEFDGFNRFRNGTRYKTQEFRLNSPGDGALRYVVGAFYSDLRQQFNYQRYYSPVDWLRDFGTESYSAYGHADFDITQQLTVQGGIRFERDKIDYVWTFLPLGPASKLDDRGVRLDFPAVNPLIVSTNEAEDDFVNYDIGLQYHLQPDVMVYGKYANANQGPVFDAEDNVVAMGGRTQATAGKLEPLPQEQVSAFEVGVKSQFLERRVTLNVSAFNQEYDNFQAQTVIIPTDPTLVPVLKLAAVGKVRTRGVEGAFNYRVSDQLTVDTNFAYTDAKILSFPNAPCYTAQTLALGCRPLPTGGTTQGSLDGARLANAPVYKANVSVNYTQPLTGTVEGYGAVQFRYQSKVNTSILQSPYTRLGDRTVFNINAGVRTERFTLELFVINLFKNKEEAYGVNNFGDTASLIYTRTIDRDNNRYGGIRLNANF